MSETIVWEDNVAEPASITPDAMPSGTDFWAKPPAEVHETHPMVEAEIKRGAAYDSVSPADPQPAE